MGGDKKGVMARDLERLFDRFRRKGDTKALAKVFDRTARDLLALAQHLVSDVGDAEDLVQSTFVTAIDRAQTYDAEQPLRPWLAGILAKHALNWNRRHQMRAAHQTTESQEPLGASSLHASPWRQACEAELQGAVEQALDRLPPRYRRVLQPYLLDTQAPEQIARTLGEAPGTVRTQIHRGLERLRRILPAGLLVGYAGSTRGWGAVRSFVLQHAQVSAAQVTVGGASLAASAASPWILGGLFVAQKTLIAGSLAVAASLAWIAWPSQAASDTKPVHQPIVEQHAPESVTAVASLTPAEVPEQAQPAPVSEAHPNEGTRTVVARGRAILKGRLLGVEPEDFAKLQWEVAQVLPLEAESEPGGPQAPKQAPQPVGGLPLLHYYPTGGAAGGNAPGERRLSTEGWHFPGQGKPRSVPLWTMPLAGVPIRPDGTFEVDLGEHVTAESDRFELRVRHEYYTHSKVGFTFGPGTRERLDDGERCEARAEVTLRPIAILQGVVQSQGEPGFAVSFTPATDSVEVADSESEEILGYQTVESPASAPILSALKPSEDSEESEQESEAVSEEAYLSAYLDLAALELSVVQGEYWLLQSHTIQLALFRFGASEPVVTGTTAFGGAFELRCEEEGAFLLVALQDGYPVLCREVQLTLRQTEVLEEELAVASGAVLAGQVNDFGLFAEGGLRVQAERLELRDPLPIEWKSDQELVWDGRQVVRARVFASTERDGRFGFQGVSPGAYRVSLSPDGLEMMAPQAEWQSAGFEARTPHQQVFLSLPASVLEVSVDLAGWTPEERERAQSTHWTLELRDVSDGTQDGVRLGRFELTVGAGQPLLVRPGTKVRIDWMAPEGLPSREVWRGMAGPIGSWDQHHLSLPLPEADPGE